MAVALSPYEANELQTLVYDQGPRHPPTADVLQSANTKKGFVQQRVTLWLFWLPFRLL